MIIINGHVKADPACVHELLADLKAGVARTQTEDGCLFYAFGIDDPEAGTILAMERWRDQAALDVHLATPAVRALMDKWAGRFEVAVRLFDASNERGFGE